MKLTYLIPTLFIVSCASNSGIVPMGNDTYMVSRQAATGFSGMGTLKADAMREAYTECQKTEIRFKCIK